MTRSHHMLTHPTVDKLHQLRCAGMAEALAEQLNSPEVEALSFAERLGLIVDRELTERASRQLTNRLRRARLRHPACMEDIDFRHPRGLDRALVLSLADGRWVHDHLNCLITGPAGVGKSWLACALAHSACRLGYSASYRRLPRLLTELAIARADARYAKLLTSLAKTRVLVIDDWGVAKLSAENRRDLLEILEHRHGLSSTIVTLQLPVKSWHDVIGDPTLADAILDRIVHNAYQLNLKGESMRKTRRPLNPTDHFTPVSATGPAWAATIQAFRGRAGKGDRSRMGIEERSVRDTGQGRETCRRRRRRTERLCRNIVRARGLMQGCKCMHQHRPDEEPEVRARTALV